jgi:hypothetical protein
MAQQSPEPLTIPDAAKRVRMTAAALYAAIKQGDLRVTEKFGRKLVEIPELRRWRRQAKIGRPKNGNKKASK